MKNLQILELKKYIYYLLHTLEEKLNLLEK